MGPYDDRNLRKKVARYAQEGRVALADQGVWPWEVNEDEDGIFEGLKLPSRWWELDRFLDDLDIWHELAQSDLR